MSIILGLKDSHRVIIAGDKRISTRDGDTIGNSSEKVFMVNNHLAYATAGNKAAGCRFGING